MIISRNIWSIESYWFEKLTQYIRGHCVGFLTVTLYEVADHSAEPRQPCWPLLNLIENCTQKLCRCSNSIITVFHIYMKYI